MELFFGPGFTVDVERPPKRIAELLEEFYCRFLATSEIDPATPPLTIGCEPAGPFYLRGTLLFDKPPLQVVADDERLVFELPGARCWWEPSADRAGIEIECADSIPVGHFVRWAFLALLFNIAPSRGWLGVHAAAIGVDGRAVVLPGSSGVGKSTIFSSAREAGLGTLSEDLVWLRPAASGFRAVAFPRGGSGVEDPEPTYDDLPVAALVFPTVAAIGPSRMVPFQTAESVRRLMSQSAFFPAAPGAGRRFDHLLHIAEAVPCFSLEVGPKRDGLATLLDGSSSLTPRSARPFHRC